MDTQQAHLIRRKLVNLTAYVNELSPYLDVLYQEHRERPGNRRIVERLAQVIVECAMVRTYDYLEVGKVARLRRLC